MKFDGSDACEDHVFDLLRKTVFYRQDGEESVNVLVVEDLVLIAVASATKLRQVKMCSMAIFQFL